MSASDARIMYDAQRAVLYSLIEQQDDRAGAVKVLEVLGLNFRIPRRLIDDETGPATDISLLWSGVSGSIHGSESRVRHDGRDMWGRPRYGFRPQNTSEDEKEL